MSCQYLFEKFLKIFFGDDKMNFSERIVSLKQERNLLQKDIALAIGVTVRNYQRYEKGTTQATLPVLISLANYFNVSADYLLGLSDIPERR